MIANKMSFEIPTCRFCDARLKYIFSDHQAQTVEGVTFLEGCQCNFQKRGSSIFEAGEQPLGLHCLNKGKVKLYKAGGGTRGQIVRLAKEGDVLGYRALISGEVYSATAEALEDTCLCFVPKDVFFKLLNSNPEISLKLMQKLSYKVS